MSLQKHMSNLSWMIFPRSSNKTAPHDFYDFWNKKMTSKKGKQKKGKQRFGWTKGNRETDFSDMWGKQGNSSFPQNFEHWKQQYQDCTICIFIVLFFARMNTLLTVLTRKMIKWFSLVTVKIVLNCESCSAKYAAEREYSRWARLDRIIVADLHQARSLGTPLLDNAFLKELVRV